jgi:hypothetical protein
MVISAVTYRLLCRTLDVAGEWRQIRGIDQELETPVSVGTAS